MKLNPIKILFGERQDKKPPVLLAVTPPRTGERTMLGVENMLQHDQSSTHDKHYALISGYIG